MVSTPSPPTPPDPKETAAAQTAMNRDTAITQYGLNATNQITPDGSLSYKQIGTWPDGTPRYEATQALSAANQRLYDTTAGTKQNLADIGQQQSGRIGNLLNTNFDGSNTATEDRLNQLARARLDPIQNQQEDALRTRLANQGIQPGSAAYDAEMRSFNNSRNDANNQLLLTGNQQAFAQAQAIRNQPINEISALMSGSQVSQPNLTQTPQSNVANTDYAGIVNQNFQNQMGVYNSQVQSNSAMMGGLFGLAGTAGSAAMKYGPGLMALSDERAKDDIEKVGKLDNGLAVYSYRYKGSDTPQIGLMAQDVAKVNPGAVGVRPDGLMAVDYHEATKRKGRRHG